MGVLAAAGGPLVGDELVALHGHGGLTLPAICGLLIKLLSESRVRNFILNQKIKVILHSSEHHH